MKSIELLKKCKEQIDNMTQSEFDNIVKKKKLDDIQYDIGRYIDNEFSIQLSIKPSPHL